MADRIQTNAQLLFELLAQRLTRDRLLLPWVDMVIHSRDVVLGFDPIAEALGRPVGWVERHAGELPIGLVHDVPCANVQFLKPYAARRSRRPTAEPRPEPVEAPIYLRLPPAQRPTEPTDWEDKRQEKPLQGTLRVVYSRARGDVLPVLAAPVFKLADKDLGSLYCSVNPLLRPLAA